jgi:hypothetical protein
VENVGETRTMGLLDLGLASGCITQGVEQAARVTPDATRIGGGTAVEGDPHEYILDSSRGFTAFPGKARKAT